MKSAASAVHVTVAGHVKIRGDGVMDAPKSRGEDGEGARMVIVVAQVSQGLRSVVRGGDGGVVGIASGVGEGVGWVVGVVAM